MVSHGPMSQRRGISRALVEYGRLLLYIPIQVGFLPLAVAGALWGMYREMVRGRKLGVSFSAIKALQYRWIMHHFGTRRDPLSVRFIKKLPCESNLALWTTLGALIVSQRWFGFTTRLGRVARPGEETLVSTPGRRILTFDKIMQEYVEEMEQVVIPGAGFDLIALTFTAGRKVRVFELDGAGTLNVKVETLRRSGLEHDWITYIPVDYETESWVDKLLEAGFDRTKRTLFLWQSVSLFLDIEIVKQTLREMAGLCADGGIIAQDFYSEAFSSGRYSRTVETQRSALERRGEPWKFGIDMSGDPEVAVESFLRECGLTMTNYCQFGEKLDIEPFYCIVEATPSLSGGRGRP